MLCLGACSEAGRLVRSIPWRTWHVADDVRCMVLEECSAVEYSFW